MTEARAEMQGAVTPFETFLAIQREILAERAMQDDQYGGSAHDDMNKPADWLIFIENQIGIASTEVFIIDGASEPEEARKVRARLLKIAALAVAGIQSIDRVHKAGPNR